MLRDAELEDIFFNRNILVTGGLGSVGTEIVNQLLLHNPKHITIMDNRETELFYAKKSRPGRTNLTYLLGDVRDKEVVSQATEDVDIIFHAAALKHVAICEDHPSEAIKTNVIGTQNVVEAAIKHDIERIVMISTDKAVNPTNVMGATKLLGERLFVAMCGASHGKRVKFGIVRFGNVLASRGSVLEIWDKQLEQGEKITVTNPGMTRFFLSIPESIELAFQASCYADRGETFILKMSSVNILDLAKAFLHLNGLPLDHFKIVGTCPGEKLHESLLFEEESPWLMENEKMFVRLPAIQNVKSKVLRFEKFGFSISHSEGFSSNNSDHLLNQSGIERVLALNRARVADLVGASSVG